MEVKELEGGAGSLEKEDHEESDDGEPELRGTEPPGAATADLEQGQEGIVTNTIFSASHFITIEHVLGPT